MADSINVQQTDPARFHALIEHSADAVSLLAADGTVLYTSPAAAQILGYTHGEYIGRNAFELIHSDDLPPNTALFAEMAQTPGATVTSQFRFRHKNGSWRWLDATGRNLLAEPGVGAIVVNFRDITERKQAEDHIRDQAMLAINHDITARKGAEQALRDSEARYRLLFDSNPHSMWVYDLETLAFLAVNDAAIHHYGYSRDEFLAMGIKDIRPAEDVPALLANLTQPPQTLEKSGSWRHRTKDGRIIDVEITSHELLFDGRPARLVLANDITERKRAEDALRESEERFRATFEQAAVGIAHVGPDGRWLRVNQALCDIVGYSREELLQRTFQDITHPDDLETDLDHVRRILAGEIQTYSLEKRYIRKDGSQVWIGLTVALMREPSGAPKYFISIIKDISERRQAEEALRESEERYRDLVENSQDLICTHDLEGRLLSVNPTAARLSGYSIESLLGTNLRDILAPEVRHVFDVYLANLQANGWASGLMQVQTAAGETRYWEYSNTLRAEGVAVPIVRGMARDITERKQAEEALREHAFYLARLNDITQAAVGTLDFQTLMQTLADRLGELIHADGCYLTLWDEARQLPIPTAASGEMRENYHTSHALPDEATMTASVLRAGHALVAEDVFNTPYLSPRIAALYPARSVLGLPLIADGQKLGAALIAFNQPHHFTPDEIARGEQAAGQIALAIAKARLLDDVQRELQERKQAEAELERSLSILQATLESTGDGILVVGDYQVVNFNQKFAAMWGIPPSILEARDNQQVMAYALPQLRDPEGFLANVSVLRTDAAAIFHDTIELKDGRAVEVYSQPQVIGGEIAGRVLSFRDITDRKQHEREREAILAVATALRVAQSRAEMLPILLDQLLKLLDADSAAVGMYDSRTGEVVIELGRGEWATATGLRLPPGEGIGGLVATTGRPYLSNDARGETRVVNPGFFKDTVALGCVPLIAQDQTIGVLWAGRGRADGPAIYPDITQDDLRLLTAIGEIAANAIHRAALHEQTQQRLERLNALRAIDLAITANTDLQVTLNIVLREVNSQLKVDAADILLLDPYSQQLKYAAGQGFRDTSALRLPVRLGQGIAGRAALEKQTLHIADLAEAKDFMQTALVAAENFVSYSVVPLVAKGQVRGVLEIFHRAPLNPDSDWLEFLATLAGQAAIAVDNNTLLIDLQNTNAQLTLAYDATIEGWSRALDLRDEETEGHSRRVTEMTLRLARAVGMSEIELVHARRGALLHDIGKMGAPDNILRKPGPLTDDEWAVMRKHPQYAYDMLSPIAYLRPALDIPRSHHEKWDGSGYPFGLKGEQIPLAARLFAIVDVWDALLADRPYRQGWPKEKVLAHIREQSGKHFDPQVVEIFLRLLGDG